MSDIVDHKSSFQQVTILIRLYVGTRTGLTWGDRFRLLRLTAGGQA